MTLVPAALLLAQVAAAQPEVTPRFQSAECLFVPLEGIGRPECGWLIVQEVRGDRQRKPLWLAVVIYRTSEPSAAPPLLLLHGEPGGNGGVRGPEAFQAMLRSPVARSRDVVSFDMRGSGLSEPTLCPDFDESAAAVFNRARVEDRARGYTDAVMACAASIASQGVEPTAYSTVASALDAIDLRNVLGYPKWDLFALSYGTQVAQELMARDAAAIRAVVLASPTTSSGTGSAEMAFTHQRALERVLSSCAAQRDCETAFPSLEADFNALYEEFARQPLEVRVENNSGRTSVWLDGARFVLETRRHLTSAAVARLPLLFHELRRGDRAAAAAEFVGDGRMDPFHPMAHLVNCNDYGADYPDAVARLRPQLRPPFQAIADDMRERCSGWFTRLLFRNQLPVARDIPTLMLNGEIDPYGSDWHSRRLAATLTRTYVYDVRGRGHEPLGPCAQTIVDGFLLDPSREPNTACLADVPGIAFEVRSQK